MSWLCYSSGSQFGGWFSHWLAVRPWASYFIYASFGFLTCKMGIKVIGMSRIKSHNECKGMNTVPGSYMLRIMAAVEAWLLGTEQGGSVDVSNALWILYRYIRNVVTTLHSCWELWHRMWREHGDCRETSQGDVVPILGLLPSPTTGMGEKLALPLVVVVKYWSRTNSRNIL